MQWITVSTFYLIFKFVSSDNNVCKSFWDYVNINDNRNCWFNQDVKASTRQIAERYGFTAEEHVLMSEDGYMLRLYRIFCTESLVQSRRQPVLMQYGVGGSPQFWMLHGEKSLAFQLCNNNYDVWLPNGRGSFSDSYNEKYSKNDSKYWDYSFHELAMYDLTATIDYVARTTKYRKKIIYIGHSMGTTMSYVYAIRNKSYAEKNILGIVSLAPVMYLNSVDLMFRLLARFSSVIHVIANFFGVYAVGQHNWFRDLVYSVCSNFPGIVICDLLNGRKFGSKANDRPDLLPVFFSFFPSPITIKTLHHYGQITGTGRFQQYDYGVTLNRKKYNSNSPPLYDVRQLSLPVHFFIGKEDNVATLEDNNELYQILKKNGVSVTRHIYENFSHNSFLIGKYYDHFTSDLLTVLNLLRKNN